MFTKDIDDFATKSATSLRHHRLRRWDGIDEVIRSPHAKDYLATYQVASRSQVMAASYRDLGIGEFVRQERLKRNGKALDEFLDKLSEWRLSHVRSC